MRILIAGQTYAPAPNGQSIFTTSLAEGLARHGHEVLAFIPSEDGRPARSERNGVHIQKAGAVNLSFLHPDVHVTLWPNRLIQEVFSTFRPNIVHIQDHYPISHAVFHAARRFKVKVIGTNHFMPENLAPYLPWPKGIKAAFNWALWKWMRQLFDRLDYVTAPSRTAAAILRRRGLKPSVVPISCGVDPHKFHIDPQIDRFALRKKYGLAPEKILFLFVGRVDGEKRVDVLLRALQILDRSDIQLGIAGKGAATNSLANLAYDLKLGDRVHFAGYIPNEDLCPLLNSADIFTMPSEAELLSIASLEAMACGKPLLLARAQALPELVDDGLNGYLFDPGNPQDAARRMAQLADQPAQWGRMGAASLRKAEAHSIENTLCSYEKLYESLANVTLLRPARANESESQRASRGQAISNLHE